ncbi:MAG: MFS transporter [Solirubrobacteraceae bacterium]
MRSAVFRRLTIAYTVNELGNWLGTVALTVAVFDHTHSAIATAALFVSLRFLPALVTTAGVTWLESLGRRRTLSALYAVQAVTTGGLAVLVLHPVLTPILVLGALDGTAALAARALLRAVVSQEAADDAARRRANGYLNVGWATTAALGPAIGGVLTGALGASSVLVIDVASFVLTAALVLQVPISRTDTPRGGILDALGDARRYIARDATLGWLLGTEAVALVFFAAVVPVEVIFAKATLDAGDAGYGALLAAWGAGMFLGSGIFARARRSSLFALLTVSTLGVAVAYLGVAAAGLLWVACAFCFVGGTGNGVQWIALITAVQERTRSDLQGRLMGIVESMGALCPALGFLLGGAVAAISNPRTTFALAGIAAAIATCAFARLAFHRGAAHAARAETSAGEPVA